MTRPPGSSHQATLPIGAIVTLSVLTACSGGTVTTPSNAVGTVTDALGEASVRDGAVPEATTKAVGPTGAGGRSPG